MMVSGCCFAIEVIAQRFAPNLRLSRAIDAVASAVRSASVTTGYYLSRFLLLDSALVLLESTGRVLTAPLAIVDGALGACDIYDSSLSLLVKTFCAYIVTVAVVVRCIPTNVH
jgi:hypothetical protein